MICICRKLSRGWNNFELMVSICRKLSRGRNQKKKFRPWLNFSNPPVLAMLHQKSGSKMKERWRGPFRVRGYEGTHSTSFTLEQLNGNKIRGSFHEDDLKQFVPRTGHLTENLPPNRSKYPTSQNIRWPRKKKRPAKDQA